MRNFCLLLCAVCWNYKSNQFGLINGDGTEKQDLIDAILGNK